MSLEKYESVCLYVQAFVAALMFSIFYSNTTFTFGSVIDIHCQFNQMHTIVFAMGIVDLIGMQWCKNKSYKIRMKLNYI
jgi:hypothetical protein